MPIPRPRKGMTKDQQQDYVSRVIASELRSWRRTGRIGTSRPKNAEEARAQAARIAYEQLREAGYSVPEPD